MKIDPRGKRAASGGEDRMPPWSAENEEGVIGCLLLDGVGSVSVCQEEGVAGEWFYDLRHRQIFAAVMECAADGLGLDVISVGTRLGALGWIEKVGGFVALGELQDKVSSAANLPNYLRVVRERFQLRECLRVGTELARRAMEEGAEVDVVVGAAETGVLALRECGAAGKESGIREILKNEVLPDLEDYRRGSAQIKGLTTGFEYLDKLLCGIGGEEDYFWVLAGRPGTGKTSFALDVVTHVALRHGYFVEVTAADAAALEKTGGSVRFDEGEGKWYERRVGKTVGVFSKEMTNKALVKRMVFQHARADLQRWRTGFATNDDMPPLMKSVMELAGARVWAEDVARGTMENIKAKARRWKKQYGVGLFVIDYLQLLRLGGARRWNDRVQELAEITGEIAALGRELRTPFLVLAQMNRDFDKAETAREPRLSDLKDCGAIEQDADGVMFLWRPKLKEKKEEEYEAAMEKVYKEDWSHRPVRVDLTVAKSRYGPTGRAELLFERASTHFEDWGRWLKEHGLRGAAMGEARERGGEEKVERGVDGEMDL